MISVFVSLAFSLSSNFTVPSFLSFFRVPIDLSSSFVCFDVRRSFSVLSSHSECFIIFLSSIEIVLFFSLRSFFSSDRYFRYLWTLLFLLFVVHQSVDWFFLIFRLFRCPLVSLDSFRFYRCRQAVFLFFVIVWNRLPFFVLVILFARSNIVWFLVLGRLSLFWDSRLFSVLSSCLSIESRSAIPCSFRFLCRPFLSLFSCRFIRFAGSCSR